MCSKTSECERIVYEKKFSRFLINKIANLGGSIKLQHITGHLSQLNLEIRETVGSSQSDILNFIKRNPNTFCFKNNIVTLVDNFKYANDFDDDSKKQDSLPLTISNGLGVIVKLFPTYGFIKVKDPVKTSVYFSAKHFLNNNVSKEINLTDFGLNIGTMVNFDAEKDKDNFSSKYRASKVWKSNKVDVENKVIYKPRKNLESGLYDPLTLDGEGIIQNVSKHVGFIAVNGNEKNTVFFHKDRVANYDNIVDLTDVFHKGNMVEFSAHRSTKQGAKAKWEAIRVWNKSGKIVSQKTQEKNSVPRSGSVTSSNHSKLSSNSASLGKDIKLKTFAREMIYDQPGKICPRCNGTVIKFGENFTQLVDGDSSVYYISGAQVTDISWEFCDGDEVKFDAVKIKSAPGWKAVLVWTGDKPDIVLPTCLGDFSAFTDEETDRISEDSSISLSENYLPASSCSSSSQKSISLKSETCNSETVQLSKDNYSLQDSSVQIDMTKENNIKESDIHSISPYSSQSNLSISSDTKLISSLNKGKLKKNKPNSVKYELDITQPQINLPITSVSKNDQFNNTHKDEQESISQYSNISDLDEEKFHLSEFSISSKSSEESEIRDIEILDCKDSEVKKTASIKEFQDMVGSVTAVYAIFAEMKSTELSESFVFFRNVFYYDESRENIDVNDLRQVLKVGCIVHFNYFEIVDDSGQFWRNVSLVWNGLKPLKFKEITPDDFIQQNNLSVTITNKPNDAQSLKQEKVKKFLTAVNTGSEDKLDNISSSLQQSSKKFLSTFNDISTEDKLDNISPPLPQQQPSKKFLSAFNDISLEDKLDNISPSLQQQEPSKKFLSAFNDISPEDKLDNISPPLQEQQPKKFLSAFNDRSPEDTLDECLSETEYFSNDNNENCKIFQTRLSTEMLEAQMKLKYDIKMLSELISLKILKNQKILMNAKVDYDDLSSEIVNIIVNRFKSEEDRDCALNKSLMEECSNNTLCSKCQKQMIENANTRNTEVQTIFTGEVMAQNVFTLC